MIKYRYKLAYNSDFNANTHTNILQVLEATIPYMYEMNMDNQENESAAERELRLLIHQSIVGGVSSIIIIISS